MRLCSAGARPGLTAMLRGYYPERTADVLCDSFVIYWPPKKRRGCTQRRNGRTSASRCGAPGDAPTGGTTSPEPQPRWSPTGYEGEREYLDRFVPWGRSCVAPGALVAEVLAFYRVDVRAILSSIHVPALVIGPREGEGEDWSVRAPGSSHNGSPARA